jgi:hypothetical protein
MASVRERIKALSVAVEANTFELGELFYEAQENGYPQKWGFASLGEYAVEELGIKHRKAQYLSHIVRIMKAAGIQRADYQPAGVTKLRSITSLDPGATYFNQETKQHEDMAEHITALVAEAPELSTKEVDERVAHLKGMDGPNAMLTKSYSVTKSCYEDVIQPCYESIRKRLGSAGRDDTGIAREYSDGVVIEALCAEYNADPRNFLEETDESQAQIEIPTEETNADREHTPSGALDKLDSEEISPHPFCVPRES